MWDLTEPGKLSPCARAEIANGANQVFVSVVSLWEIAVKYGLGKVAIGSLELQDLLRHCRASGLPFLSLDPEETIESRKLKGFSSRCDPFDRMLIYQAINKKDDPHERRRAF